MATQLEISDIFHTIWCQKYLAFNETANIDINHIRISLFWARHHALFRSLDFSFISLGIDQVGTFRYVPIKIDSQSIIFQCQTNKQFNFTFSVSLNTRKKPTPKSEWNITWLFKYLSVEAATAVAWKGNLRT